jgi:hypothetical protein
MRLFLLTIAVTLLMVHNMVPHHHHDEPLSEEHHDMDHHHQDDHDDDDQGLAYLLANISHNTSTEKIIHHSANPSKGLQKEIGNDLSVLNATYSPVVREQPPDFLSVSKPDKILPSLFSISLLRAPPLL